MLHCNDCTLSIYGRLHATAIDRLSSSLFKACPGKLYQNSPIATALTPFHGPIYGKPCAALYFPHVRNAEMDDRLASDLNNLSLSWTWSWTSSETRAAGIILHNADRNETAEFHTILNQIALLTSELNRAQAALRWHDWRMHAVFTIIG